MVDFYEEMQGVTTGLLTEFKQGVIKLIVMTPGNGKPYDPGEPTERKITMVGAVARGVSKQYVDGKDIVGSDIQVTASVAGTDDETGAAVQLVGPYDKTTHKVEIDGVPYRIVALPYVPAAGTRVVNVFIVRK